MKTLWEIKTGKPIQREAVDAVEIMRNSPDVYTDVEPENAKDADAAKKRAAKRGDSVAPGNPGTKSDGSINRGKAVDVGDDGKEVREMTKAELKELLDKKGVQYPASANRDELVELAEVANAEPKQE